MSEQRISDQEVWLRAYTAMLPSQWSTKDRKEGADAVLETFKQRFPITTASPATTPKVEVKRPAGVPDTAVLSTLGGAKIGDRVMVPFHKGWYSPSTLTDPDAVISTTTVIGKYRGNHTLTQLGWEKDEHIAPLRSANSSPSTQIDNVERFVYGRYVIDRTECYILPAEPKTIPTPAPILHVPMVELKDVKPETRVVLFLNEHGLISTTPTARFTEATVKQHLSNLTQIGWKPPQQVSPFKPISEITVAPHVACIPLPEQIDDEPIDLQVERLYRKTEATGYWRKRNGVQVRIADMDINHLANAYRMLERNGDTETSSPKMRELGEELRKRACAGQHPAAPIWTRPIWTSGTFKTVRPALGSRVKVKLNDRSFVSKEIEATVVARWNDSYVILGWKAGEIQPGWIRSMDDFTKPDECLGKLEGYVAFRLGFADDECSVFNQEVDAEDATLEHTADVKPDTKEQEQEDSILGTVAMFGGALAGSILGKLATSKKPISTDEIVRLVEPAEQVSDAVAEAITTAAIEATV